VQHEKEIVSHIHFSQYYLALFEVTRLSWTILILCDLPTALSFAFMEQASSLFLPGVQVGVVPKLVWLLSSRLRLRTAAHGMTEPFLHLFGPIRCLQNWLVTDISQQDANIFGDMHRFFFPKRLFPHKLLKWRVVREILENVRAANSCYFLKKSFV